MSYSQTLDAVHHSLNDDEPLSAEMQLERKCDWLVRELDEICALANNKETRDLVEKQATAIGQIQFRAGLVLSFIDADKQLSNLRIVR